MRLILFSLLFGVITAVAQDATPKTETLAQLGARVGQESQTAYAQSPFSALSKDYFLRFGRDADAKPKAGELVIDDSFRIVTRDGASQLAARMGTCLRDFLARSMSIRSSLATVKNAEDKETHSIVLSESGGGKDDVPASFTITVNDNGVQVRGKDPEGLRDGVVKLVEQIGMRQAPFLAKTETTFTPRLRVRLGVTPTMGSYRDLVFMGFNAAFVSGGSLFGLSNSDAIPELAKRREKGSLDGLAAQVREARQWGLKTYAQIGMRDKFDKNDPIFTAHPDIRGALTWKADGQYVLCTEHPLVRKYLMESIAGIFRAAPDLDGIEIIIGGESFYHCFMRPFGVEKGHTNCPRCEALGADTVVSNLVNSLAEAARTVNPKAEVVAWPYSAEHVWSSDKAQSGFIAKLKPGAAIFTEMEKDETVDKPDGVHKALWDYSIDLIGPGNRAKQQIAACRAVGIPIFMKSEPEIGFEAPRLPDIPCLDRWVDRAEAMASCGADGAWVFPAFRPCYGTPAAESYKLVWWNPAPDKETVLNELAARVAGPEAGLHLRAAWRFVSEAIPFSPEFPPYYTGPYYLGPAHPMCADPNAKLPEVFDGRFLFLAEMTDDEGMKLRPTYFTSPRGDVPVFGKMYREMEGRLKQAVDEIDKAKSLVPSRCSVIFASEESSTRWFYHTARTHANFYESCQLRDRLVALAAQASRTQSELDEAKKKYARWVDVLKDEKANTEAALPVMEKDVRLDFYYGEDHAFSHGADMMRAKLGILDHELNEYLPSLAKKLGV